MFKETDSAWFSTKAIRRAFLGKVNEESVLDTMFEIKYYWPCLGHSDSGLVFFWRYVTWPLDDTRLVRGSTRINIKDQRDPVAAIPSVYTWMAKARWAFRVSAIRLRVQNQINEGLSNKDLGEGTNDDMMGGLCARNGAPTMVYRHVSDYDAHSRGGRSMRKKVKKKTQNPEDGSVSSRTIAFIQAL